MKVNEIFGPTIQGEGKSAGREVLFLRLALCNLHCVWCDTPHTWNWSGTPFSHPEKFEKKDEIHEMEIDDILAALNALSEDVRSLVISGGEPLLQQRDLLPLLVELKARGWWIEIETNGTIAPTSEFDEYVDQFNCSPKLANSGNSVRLRIHEEALQKLADNAKVYFKFVVAGEDDVPEVLSFVERYSMERVYLMPLGKTAEELEETREIVRGIAERLRLQFTDRLHITLFGGVRGT